MKILFKLLLFAGLLLPYQLKAQNHIADAIALNRSKLHYPRSVRRFYQEEGFRLVWVLKDSVKTPAWNAMLFLDCVLQYGLNPLNYHVKDLTYDKLHLAQSGTVSDIDKASYDVILTDAIITLINNLHYGTRNPDFSAKRIDVENTTELKGDKILIDALEVNNLMDVILNVQPHSEAYTNLQRHMMLLTTKYSGSNYVKPVNDIRNMAISMERLRWINTTGKTFHIASTVREGVIVSN